MAHTTDGTANILDPHAPANPDLPPRHARPTRPSPRLSICPYCGQVVLNTQRCDACRGLLDPLSRQASQNAMGPWYIKDDAAPFRPGCSFDTLGGLIRRGKITSATILRGPTTRQFWTYARNAPGVANLLGECHSCHAPAGSGDAACRSCGASFDHARERQHLGLAPVHILPGHASPGEVAAASFRTPGDEAVSPPGLSSPDAQTPYAASARPSGTASAFAERGGKALPADPASPTADSQSDAAVRRLRRRVGYQRAAIAALGSVCVVLAALAALAVLRPELTAGWVRLGGGVSAPDDPQSRGAAPVVVTPPSQRLPEADRDLTGPPGPPRLGDRGSLDSPAPAPFPPDPGDRRRGREPAPEVDPVRELIDLGTRTSLEEALTLLEGRAAAGGTSPERDAAEAYVRKRLEQMALREGLE